MTSLPRHHVWSTQQHCEFITTSRDIFLIIKKPIVPELKVKVRLLTKINMPAPTSWVIDLNGTKHTTNRLGRGVIRFGATDVCRDICIPTLVEAMGDSPRARAFLVEDVTQTQDAEYSILAAPLLNLKYRQDHRVDNQRNYLTLQWRDRLSGVMVAQANDERGLWVLNVDPQW